MIAKAQATGQVDPALDAELVAFLLNQVFSGFGDFLLRLLELDPATLAGGCTSWGLGLSRFPSES